MKKIISIFFVAVWAMVSMSSCGGDDEGGSKNESKDNYYVKYSVSNGKQISYASYNERTIIYTTPERDNSIETRQSEWEGTYGPFKKGDKVILSIRVTMARNSTNASISVCKNSEPFAVKAECSEVKDGASLHYVIDY